MVYFYRLLGGEGTTLVSKACPEDLWGKNFPRVELERKSDGKEANIITAVLRCSVFVLLFVYTAVL